MRRIGLIVDGYEDSNDKARADESGADVVAVCGNCRIGIQVTDLDTGEKLGQARRAETRRARDAASRDSTYWAWGQNDPSKVVAAIEQSITRKARMSFAGFHEFWLLLCCGVPEMGAIASTSVMTPWVDTAALDRATLDKLASSKYSRAFIYSIAGVEEQALYQWDRGGCWSKSTVPVPPEQQGPDFWQYKSSENKPELHSDPVGWCKREAGRVVAEEAKKVQALLSARERRYILRETAAPYGTLKIGYISVREADGALVFGPFIYDVLDQLLRDGVVKLEGPHTQQDNLIYRLVG
jgi:hypothetical protein